MQIAAYFRLFHPNEKCCLEQMLSSTFTRRRAQFEHILDHQKVWWPRYRKATKYWDYGIMEEKTLCLYLRILTAPGHQLNPGCLIVLLCMIGAVYLDSSSTKFCSICAPFPVKRVLSFAWNIKSCKLLHTSVCSIPMRNAV